MAKVKVRVKVITSWGKTCLREIRGLEEGTIKVGRYNERVNPTAVEIKHNGEDAVLWIGENCTFVKGYEFKFRVIAKYKQSDDVIETSRTIKVMAQDESEADDKVETKLRKAKPNATLIDFKSLPIV